MAMPTGTVRWFHATKGFGFIARDDGSPDVFVHISAVERAAMTGLREGQKLQFDIVENPRNRKLGADNLKAL